MKHFASLIATVVMVITFPVAAPAQLGEGNLFTEHAFVDSPELARDRDWLLNYLAAGKTYEERENIRDRVERMSAAQVKHLLHFYHQKDHLARQREAASRDGETDSPRFGQGSWLVAPRPGDPAERQRADDNEVRARGQDVAREARQRPRFRFDAWMPFRFDPMPLDYSIYWDDPFDTQP